MNEAILDLCRKLGNMTTENGCTPSEAASAAERLKNLLDKHNLTMFDVRTETFAEKLEERTVETGPRMRKYYISFMSSVAQAFDCGLIISGDRYKRWYRFVGFKSDVEVAHFFFEQIYPKILKAAKLGSVDYLHRAGKERYIDSFVRGAGHAIRDRLKAARETPSDVTAMIHVKSSQVAAYVDEQTGGEEFKLGNAESADGYQSGAEYGRRAEIRHGLGGPAPSNLPLN